MSEPKIPLAKALEIRDRWLATVDNTCLKLQEWVEQGREAMAVASAMVVLRSLVSDLASWIEEHSQEPANPQRDDGLYVYGIRRIAQPHLSISPEECNKIATELRLAGQRTLNTQGFVHDHSTLAEHLYQLANGGPGPVLVATGSPSGLNSLLSSFTEYYRTCALDAAIRTLDQGKNE